MKTIIFDFDGTIADIWPEVAEIYNKLAETRGYVHVLSGNLYKLQSLNPRELIRTLGIPLYKIFWLSKALRQEVAKEIINIKPFDKMADVFSQLQTQNFKVGIVSTDTKENIKIFSKLNNFPKPDFIYTGHPIFGKTRILKRAIKQERLNPEETIYIGDELHDVVVARRCGLKIISVTWGLNNKKSLEILKPTYLVDKPEDILGLVKGL